MSTKCFKHNVPLSELEVGVFELALTLRECGGYIRIAQQDV